MALIKCPECGEKVSTQAEACPHCGYVYNPRYDYEYLSKCEVLYTGPKHSAYRESATPDVLFILLGIVLIPIIIGVIIIIAAVVDLSNRRNFPERNNDAMYYDKPRKEIIIYSYRSNVRHVMTINDIIEIERKRSSLWVNYIVADGTINTTLFGSYNEMQCKALLERLKEINPHHKIAYVDHKHKKKSKIFKH